MVRLGLVLVACLALCAPAADAAPITFSYEGTVETVSFYDSSIFSDPAGAPFSGEYTFDSTALDLIGGNVNGSYAGSSLSLTIGGQTLAFGGVSIGTTNSVGLDQYLVSFFDSLTSLSIRLEDSAGTALASDALPLLAPDLAPFETRFFFFQLVDSNFSELLTDVNGRITSLECVAGCVEPPTPTPVPEPATLSLLAGGIGALVARRRARRS